MTEQYIPIGLGDREVLEFLPPDDREYLNSLNDAFNADLPNTANPPMDFQRMLLLFSLHRALDRLYPHVDPGEEVDVKAQRFLLTGNAGLSLMEGKDPTAPTLSGKRPKLEIITFLNEANYLYPVTAHVGGIDLGNTQIHAPKLRRPDELGAQTLILSAIEVPFETQYDEPFKIPVLHPAAANVNRACKDEVESRTGVYKGTKIPNYRKRLLSFAGEERFGPEASWHSIADAALGAVIVAPFIRAAVCKNVHQSIEEAFRSNFR